MGRTKKNVPKSQVTSNISELDQADLSDPDAVINGIRFGMNKIKKLTEETIPKCPNDELRQSVATRMESCLLKLVKAEMTYSKASGIVTQVVEEMPDDVNSDASAILKTCDNIADISMDRISTYEGSLTEEDLKQHRAYTSLMSDIQKLLEDGEDEEESEEEVDEESDKEVEEDGEEAEDDEEKSEEEQSEEEEESEEEVVQNEEDLLPTVDPITKTELKDPVRNSKCGHIYGKATVTQLIKKNAKTRCPIAGCSNKDFIKVAHLVADRKLTIQIRKKQAEQKKTRRR